MKLGTCEFLRRFFLHVLPKAFLRIRHFGFLANRFRASRVSLCRQLLAYPSCAASETSPPSCDNSVWHCPTCGAAMIILTVLALNRKTSAALHMVSSRFPLTVALLCCSRPQSFSILNISCTLCVTSTQIPTTHHIILAAPDGSEHSETEIRLVSRQRCTNVSRNPGASRRLFFCHPRHSGRN